MLTASATLPQHCGIYTISADDNSAVYVGMSRDIPRRWRQHRAALARTTHHNYKLQALVSSGAKLRYTIVMECSEQNLAASERSIWRGFLTAGVELCNQAEPGTHRFNGRTKPVVATDAAGNAHTYSSAAVAVRALNLNYGRVSCHLRGIPKDTQRRTVAPTVNGYKLSYA